MTGEACHNLVLQLRVLISKTKKLLGRNAAQGLYMNDGILGKWIFVIAASERSKFF